MSILEEADDRCGVILKYGGKSEYLYFERHEARQLLSELQDFVVKWDRQPGNAPDNTWICPNCGKTFEVTSSFSCFKPCSRGGEIK